MRLAQGVRAMAPTNGRPNAKTTIASVSAMEPMDPAMTIAFGDPSGDNKNGKYVPTTKAFRTTGGNSGNTRRSTERLGPGAVTPANSRRQGRAIHHVKSAAINVVRLPKTMSITPRGDGFNAFDKRHPMNTPGMADGNNAGKAVKASASRNCSDWNAMNDVINVNATYTAAMTALCASVVRATLARLDVRGFESFDTRIRYRSSRGRTRTANVISTPLTSQVWACAPSGSGSPASRSSS
jgi:hypothetical protein